MMRIKTVNFIIAAFFIVFLVLPLCSMLHRITAEGFLSLVKMPQFKSAVKNTIVTSLTATAISVIIAFLAAWCLERTSIKFKSVFAMMFVLPMLIPSISHAFGLVSLFGANGFLTNIFKLKRSIYGFVGILAGSVMYSFPVAFLMFDGVLKYEDCTAYKAAEVLGIDAFHRFSAITVPYLKKTLISVFFAVFTMIVTDYGVPLMVGGKTVTLSVLMFNRAVSMIDYDSGSVIGAILLIPAVVAFLVDFFNKDNGQSSFITESAQLRGGPCLLPAYCYCILLCLCVLAPVVSFCFMFLETKYPVNREFTVSHVIRTINRGAGTYLLNSVIYAVLSAISGTVFAFCCSYLTARVKNTYSKILHLISITSMAIPGIVLGLSYVIFFHNTPVYSTAIIVVLANMIHFFSSPYLMMYNTLAKVNMNLESVGMILGVGRLRIVFDVIVPKVRCTLFEMFGYFFVNSMMTISAVAFLAPPSPKPVALMINQFEAQRLMESAAFVSLLILAVNLFMKGVIILLEKRDVLKAS